MKNKIKQTSIVLVLALFALASFVSAGVGYMENDETIMIDDPIIGDFSTNEEKAEFNEKAQYPTSIEGVSKMVLKEPKMWLGLDNDELKEKPSGIVLEGPILDGPGIQEPPKT